MFSSFHAINEQENTFSLYMYRFHYAIIVRTREGKVLGLNDPAFWRVLFQSMRYETENMPQSVELASPINLACSPDSVLECWTDAFFSWHQ